MSRQWTAMPVRGVTVRWRFVWTGLAGSGYAAIMCGRVALLTYDELEEVLDAVGARRRPMRLQAHADRAQARPGDGLHAMAVRGGADDAGGGLAVMPFTWGFNLSDGKRLVFNTRIESALGGSGLWSGPIREGRCVLPVAAFFEPHGSETAPSPRTGRRVKRQYEFTSPDGEPLLLASVAWSGRLSVVTTEPNASVAPVHPRMPLALRFEEVRTWLDGDFPTLAGRSRPDLLAYPEDGELDGGPEQLSLF